MFQKNKNNDRSEPENKSNLRFPESPSQDNAMLFANSLVCLIKQALKESLIDMENILLGINTCLSQNLTQQKEIMYSLGSIKEQLQALRSENKMLENASYQNRLLTEQHYQKHIIDPMIRSLFAVIDFIDGAKISQFREDHTIPSDVSRLLDGIDIQLCQFLSTFQIEPIQHRPGDRFDPKFMKPAKIAITNKVDWDKRVAQSLQTGFRRGKEILLRPEQIILYKYEQPDTKTEPSE